MCPKIVADDNRGLVVDEAHWPPVAVWAMLMLFTLGPPVWLGVVVAQKGPVLRPDLGPLAAMAVGSSVLFGGPLLAVLAVRRYRRVEVRPGAEVVCERRSYLFSPRAERVPWADLHRARCVFVPGSGGSDGTADGLRLFLDRADGRTTQALSGWWSQEVADALRRHMWQKMAE